MSISCELCGKYVSKPDRAWYAVIKAALFGTTMCGTCVSRIPESARHSVDHQLPTKITFGRIIAETNSRGGYHYYQSRPGPVCFWIEAEDIEKSLPNGQVVLKDLYPYYCPEERLAELSAEIRDGDRESLFTMGAFLKGIDRPDEAVVYLEQVVETDQKYQFAVYHLWQIYKAKEEQAHVRAEKYLERITEPDLIRHIQAGGKSKIIKIKCGDKVWYP